MHAEWRVIETVEDLYTLTGVEPDVRWCAVAIPAKGQSSAVLTAAWKGDRVWAFIDVRHPVSGIELCRAVRAFHACLRDGGATEVYGVRADHATPRWMEWLGAEKTDETVGGLEVWVWRN